ncbi:MAG TPA: hypothetical protein PLP59_12520 [Thermotogota bacterium]|nr:hypothetical protein [Thermotogota bacterium]HQN23145.1 hypothetical protein [Thermotogota bacterium]HQQ67123.1 hypothetical protein [Thermotogota bacterium]
MEEAGIESGVKALLEAILKGSKAEAEGITMEGNTNPCGSSFNER